MTFINQQELKMIFFIFILVTNLWFFVRWRFPGLVGNLPVPKALVLNLFLSDLVECGVAGEVDDFGQNPSLATHLAARWSSPRSPRNPVANFQA